ncbi:hypothetical protein LJC34_00295 [Oscillospiraceae bacterium OttesenSCG-928-G22]|nr:hypothetical protein [Oscillospiraceae bacterium OttesenSCG-928-G22]
MFAHHTTTSEETTAADSKTVTETQTAETESKALENVLKKFPATIVYEQDGYTGALVLDTGSISTEAAGYRTSSWTVSTTQTYPSLMYQDPSLIPQTAVKDGHTLSLSDVSWTVTGTSLAGETLVPTEYTATATYSKKVSSQVATGYISTASYSGEVSKSEVSAVIYTLTYIGTPLPEPEPEPIPEPESAPWGRIAAGIAMLLALGGAIAVFLWLRAQQGVAVYNLVEDDYLCIGRQRLDLRQPVVDLNEFEDIVQSKYFSFVLDKSTTRKLFGRNISVTQGDITMTHRVKDMDGKYRFNLEMGVEL